MKIETFLDKYKGICPQSKVVIDDFINDWGEGFPSVILLSSLGQEFVKKIEMDDIDSCESILKLIEYGIIHGEISLQNSCATGFLEAVAFRLFERDGLYQKFFSLLGEKSKTHIGKLMDS